MMLRVIYGDTDQMGFAYYANYLRWFEVARNEYLRTVGYPYRRSRPRHHPPVVEANLPLPAASALRRSAAHRILDRRVGRVRVRFAYRVLRAGDAEPLPQGLTVHASLGPNSVPTRFAGGLRQGAARVRSRQCGLKATLGVSQRHARYVIFAPTAPAASPAPQAAGSLSLRRESMPFRRESRNLRSVTRV
jgi:acyl-CoA thioester hydrolase